jgi:hypothetical protein
MYNVICNYEYCGDKKCLVSERFKEGVAHGPEKTTDPKRGAAMGGADGKIEWSTTEWWQG